MPFSPNDSLFFAKTDCPSPKNRIAKIAFYWDGYFSRFLPIDRWDRVDVDKNFPI